VDEGHPPQPSTPYGMSKVVGERMVHFVTGMSGMDWTILRYANVYGPRQPIKGEAGVIGIFARALLRKQVPYITGDGEQTKDYIYVSDVAALNLAILDRGSKCIFNAGTGVGTTVNEIFAMLAKKIGATCTPSHVEPREGDCSFVFDAGFAKKQVGWQPKVSLTDGMDLTIAYERVRCQV
jgi:UDP-glucose 4-epimerase